jgi:hypothetical protein
MSQNGSRISARTGIAVCLFFVLACGFELLRLWTYTVSNPPSAQLAQPEASGEIPKPMAGLNDPHVELLASERRARLAWLFASLLFGLLAALLFFPLALRPAPVQPSKSSPPDSRPIAVARREVFTVSNPPQLKVGLKGIVVSMDPVRVPNPVAIALELRDHLTVIGVYSELLLENLPLEGPYRFEVEEIRRAYEKTILLSRQIRIHPDSVSISSSKS